MEVRRVEKDIYMFSFQHKADLQKVFRKIPWSIRGGHMVLKRWNPNLSWQEVDFFVSIFWVQVHRLPSLWLSKNNLKKIGSLVGEVLEVEFVGDGGGFWKKFSRIQVCIWIPLILLKTENNKKIIKSYCSCAGYYSFSYLHYSCPMNSARSIGP